MTKRSNFTAITEFALLAATKRKQVRIARARPGTGWQEKNIPKRENILNEKNIHAHIYRAYAYLETKWSYVKPCIRTNSPQTYLRNQQLITFSEIVLSKNHKKPLKRCIGTAKERKKPIRTDRILCTRAQILFLSSLYTHTCICRCSYIRSFFLPLINALSSFLSFAYLLNLRFVRSLTDTLSPPPFPLSLSHSFTVEDKSIRLVRMRK